MEMEKGPDRRNTADMGGVSGGFGAEHQHPSQQGGAVPGQPGAGPLPVEPPAGPSQPAHHGMRTAGPIQVVACRRLSAAQYKAACRASGGGRRTAALVLLLLLNALLTFRLVGGLWIYPRGWQASVFTGLMLLALAAGIAAALWIFLRPGRLLEKACACYLDSEPPEGVIELYNDRVVQITAASVEVVEFRRVNRMVETADLILIGQPGRTIAWRAEDLAPYDAHFLLDALQRRIPPSYHRRKAPFHPWLREPLPLPVIRGGAPVWLTVSVPDDGQTAGEELRRLCPAFLALLFPLLLFAGGQAMYAHLTPSLLLDTGIYALLSVLVLATVLLIAESIRLTSRAGRAAPREYAFTPDGLAVKTGDSVGFIHKRHIAVKNGKKAVRLQTPVGCFTIPWSEVGDPDRLRQILSL